MTALNFDTEDFLANTWQRKPLLIRNAVTGWEPPIDANDLAGLSCEDGVTARLVQQDRSNWTVRTGPFDESEFVQLGESDWTLLVQDVDKWSPECARLLDAFGFLPSWRIDDIMVSYAAPGGSVGPHVDHYDVFLLQAAGQRKWLIDQSGAPDLSFREDLELRILQSFTPTDEWILEPGDMLYLPPGVPHHGIGMDDCMTWSIGLRAPGRGEFLRGLADRLALSLPESQRYTDPGRPQPGKRGELSPFDIERVRTLLTEVLLQADDGVFTDALAGFLTEYQLPEDPDHDICHDGRIARVVMPSSWSRWIYREVSPGHARVYVNGDVYAVTTATARKIVDERRLDTEEMNNNDRRVVEQWWSDRLILSAV